MKKKTFLIASIALLPIVTGCSFLDPNSKGIGEVFEMAYDKYEINLNTNNYPTMEYQVDVSLSAPDVDSSVLVVKCNPTSVYFQQTVNYETEVDQNFYVRSEYTGYIDYTDDRLYYEKTDSEVSSTGTTVSFHEKTSVSLSNPEIQSAFTSATDIKSTLENEIIPQLKSPAVDLLVGKSSLTNNEYNYELSILSLLDLSFLEQLIGVTPSDATFSFTYNISTFDLVLEGTYEFEEETYQIDVTLSHPGQINDSETVLTSTQKSQYSN